MLFIKYVECGIISCIDLQLHLHYSVYLMDQT